MPVKMIQFSLPPSNLKNSAMMSKGVYLINDKTFSIDVVYIWLCKFCLDYKKKKLPRTICYIYAMILYRYINILNGGSFICSILQFSRVQCIIVDITLIDFNNFPFNRSIISISQIIAQ